MSPGQTPRPSLSDRLICRRNATGHVSPGQTPRPSLSERAEKEAASVGIGVAGADAPAFVERDRGDGFQIRFRGAWSGFAGTHNRLSFRCRSVVWLLTRRPGAVPGPVAGDLPKAGHDCREVRESGFRPEGEKRPSDEPFELPGAQDRAQGVFPQPPKTAFSARPVDPEWINPIGRGSDEVQKERRIRAEQRMRGRKTGRIRPVGMKRE